MTDSQTVADGEEAPSPEAGTPPPSPAAEAGTPPPSPAAEAGTPPLVPPQETVAGEETPDQVAELEALVAERTLDLQRVAAEYVNYKKRVDRDRDLARQAGIEAVVNDLMPVLDHIELARQHENLEGGFKMIADELQKVATKHGLTVFGAVGDAFDPNLHDALMEVPMDEPVELVTVSQVMQQGYLLGSRVIRPARVAVANP